MRPDCPQKETREAKRPLGLQTPLFLVLTIFTGCSPAVGMGLAPSPSEEAKAAHTAQYRISSSGCYFGPVEVRVEYPDGKPAANLPVSLGGMHWYSSTGVEPPPLFRPRFTDQNGRFAKETWKECLFPTMFYSLDEKRKLAGIRICESMGDLAEPQTVRLQPARWVSGHIVSSELAEYGRTSSFYRAELYPDNPINGRRLLHTNRTGRFRFLVPPGEYSLFIQGEHLEYRTYVRVFVPKGSQPMDLGRIELRAHGVVRLPGKPAPPWHVAEWLDGKPRTLASFRGRPVLLCFWSRGNSSPQSLFDLAHRYGGAKLAIVVIHRPLKGGFAELRQTVAAWKSDPQAAGLESDIDQWPFLLAMDKPGHTHGHGMTDDRYGSVTSCQFLIDAEGRVVAGAHAYDMTPLESALAKLDK